MLICREELRTRDERTPGPSDPDIVDVAEALGLMPAARAVLSDPFAPVVLRDRALYVVTRAVRSARRTD